MAKAKGDDNRITVLGFSKKLGCSHTAVNDAIREGHLKEGYDAVAKRIVYDVAMVEWGNNFLARRVAKVEAQMDTAAAYAGDSSAGAESGERGKPVWDGSGEIPAGISYPEALRITQILKARAEQRDNDEAAGLLVKKVDVDRQLMVAGIEIRKKMELFPMQVVDAVRAADNRNSAIRVMEDAVRALLDSMGEVITKAIGSNNGSMAE